VLLTTPNHAKAPTGSLRSCLGKRSWLSSKGISLLLTPRVLTLSEELEAAIPSNCCAGQGFGQSAVDQHLILRQLQTTTYDCGFWKPNKSNTSTEEQSACPDCCQLEATKDLTQACSFALGVQSPQSNIASLAF